MTSKRAIGFWSSNRPVDALVETISATMDMPAAPVAIRKQQSLSRTYIETKLEAINGFNELRTASPRLDGYISTHFGVSGRQGLMAIYVWRRDAPEIRIAMQSAVNPEIASMALDRECAGYLFIDNSFLERAVDMTLKGMGVGRSNKYAGGWIDNGLMPIPASK